MRSTVFGNSNENNPNNIWDVLIGNLEVLIEYKCVIRDDIPYVFQNMLKSYFPVSLPEDPSKHGQIDIEALTSILRQAILGLKTLRDIGKPTTDINPPLNQNQIDAMLSIPAIVRNWDMMMKYKPLQSMHDLPKELTLAQLREADSSRLYEIAKLERKLDRLKQEQSNLAALKNSINKKQIPVKDFSYIKEKIDMIRHGKGSAEDNEFWFTQICKMIATSEDPDIAFQQTYSLIKSRSFPNYLVWALDKCAENKSEFERFFGQYGYEPTNSTSLHR